MGIFFRTTLSHIEKKLSLFTIYKTHQQLHHGVLQELSLGFVYHRECSGDARQPQQAADYYNQPNRDQQWLLIFFLDQRRRYC
jgi:hypothetical protein